IYIGDFNGHEQEWVGSKSKTNAMGTAVKDFCEAQSFENLVKLPTRGDNVLDLVLSSKGGEVSYRPPIGSSDHLALVVDFDLGLVLPPPPPVR
ncbi:unnamed protein product, partial [Heterosigma akashiwo]